jgi:hypothetical protein
VKEIPLSLPADKIVTCLPEAFVTLPPEAKAPPIVNAALFPTEAAVEIPSASRATSSLIMTAVTSDPAILISFKI